MREVACVMADQLVEVAPELTPGTVADAKRHDDIEKRAKVIAKVDLTGLDTVLMKAGKAIERSLIVLVRAVDISNDFLVTLDQPPCVHPRNEV